MTNRPVHVSVFGKTDLGRTRDHNEDTFLVADLSTGNASLHPEVREHVLGPRGSLFMVADGMGGAAAGELASAMAADLIYRHLATALGHDAITRPSGSPSACGRRSSWPTSEIYSYAREHPEVRGMGTTVTAAGVYGDDLYLAQIGDSRAYLVRDGDGDPAHARISRSCSGWSMRASSPRRRRSRASGATSSSRRSAPTRA